MHKRFHSITSEDGRRLVQELGALVFPNLDLVDVVVFDVIWKRERLHGPKLEQANKSMR